MGAMVEAITWRTLGVGLALVAVLGSYWGIYQHGRSVERAAWQARWAERDTADSAAVATGQAAAREEEQRRSDAQEEARAHAKEQQRTADADAAGADDAGKRLRDEASKLAAVVSCPSSDTGAAARGASATRAAMVLSDLLARADARAGELAKAYDAARIAGQTCEAAYTALIN